MGGLIDKIWAARDGKPMTLEAVRGLLGEIAAEMLEQIKLFPMEAGDREAVENLVRVFMDFCAGLVMDQLTLIDTSLRAFQGLGARLDIVEAQIGLKTLNDEHPHQIN